MRKELHKSANVTPLPVLMIATYNDDGTANVMNAAWGTQYSVDTVMINLSNHRTTENLKKREAFTLSYATKKTVVESDYFGIVSGAKENKLQKAKFHAIKSEHVDAPLIEEYPLTLECKVDKLVQDGPDSYILYGKVLAVSADESILTKGKVDIGKLEPIAFCPFDGTYRVVRDVAGAAFRCGLAIKRKKAE